MAPDPQRVQELVTAIVRMNLAALAPPYTAEEKRAAMALVPTLMEIEGDERERKLRVCEVIAPFVKAVGPGASFEDVDALLPADIREQVELLAAALPHVGPWWRAVQPARPL